MSKSMKTLVKDIKSAADANDNHKLAKAVSEALAHVGEKNPSVTTRTQKPVPKDELEETLEALQDAGQGQQDTSKAARGPFGGILVKLSPLLIQIATELIQQLIATQAGSGGTTT